MKMASIIEQVPQLKRGTVWCKRCGRELKLHRLSLRNAWPKCCGETMTIDSPEERAAIAKEKEAQHA